MLTCHQINYFSFLDDVKRLRASNKSRRIRFICKIWLAWVSLKKDADALWFILKTDLKLLWSTYSTLMSHKMSQSLVLSNNSNKISQHSRFLSRSNNKTNNNLYLNFNQIKKHFKFYLKQDTKDLMLGSLFR